MVRRYQQLCDARLDLDRYLGGADLLRARKRILGVNITCVTSPRFGDADDRICRIADVCLVTLRRY